MIFIIGGMYQGKGYLAEQMGGKILKDLHLKVREYMENGKEIDIDFESYDVITCNEVGCGVIPMEEFEREWREKVGRVSCEVAEKATDVFRVSAGIAVKIK